MGALISIALYLLIGGCLMGYVIGRYTTTGRYGDTDGQWLMGIFGTLLWPVVIVAILPGLWAFRRGKAKAPKA